MFSGHARVSTDDQDIPAQLATLKRPINLDEFPRRLTKLCGSRLIGKLSRCHHAASAGVKIVLKIERRMVLERILLITIFQIRALSVSRSASRFFRKAASPTEQV